MQFTAAAILAFAASAYAQVAGFDALSTPAKGEQVPAGQTYKIVWAPAAYTGQATITLLGGASDSTLEVLSTIATVDNAAGSYDWAVDASLGDKAVYGIKIALVSDAATFQYGFPFAISKSTASGSSSSAGGYPVSGYPTVGPTKTGSTTTLSVTSEKSSSSYPATTVKTSTAPHHTTTVISSSSYPVVTPSGNLSTTAAPTTLTSVTSATRASSSTSAPTTVPTAGAARAAAGGLALIGGLAAAVFAL